MKGTVWLYEFIGTALLCVAVNWGAASGDSKVVNPATGVPTFSGNHQAECVALTLLAIAMFLGPISGGHVNPAVSIGVLVRAPDEKRGENIVLFLGYVVAQILGGFVGCAFCVLAYQHDSTTGQMIPTLAALCPPIGTDAGAGNPECLPGPAVFQALMAEIIGTFIFVSVVLQVVFNGGPATPNTSVVNSMTVAGALFCALTIAAPTSGAAINPAVGIAQTVFQSIVDDAVVPKEMKKKGILSIWIYIVGPLIGGILAGIWSRFINEYAKTKQEEAQDFD